MFFTTAAVAVPFARAAERVFGPRGCLFTFHRAAPSELWSRLPNRNFHIDIAFLDKLLTYVRASGWDIVTVEEALRRSARGEGGRYVNFSIDDCYRDTHELVAPLFRRHGAPLTLYVTTGIPDGTLSLWWAGLEDALFDRDHVRFGKERMALATWEEKRAAYQRISSFWDGADAASHYAEFCVSNGINRETMHWKHAVSWKMLEELARDPLIEIGAHTVNHPRVSSLGLAAARAELEQSRRRLSERLGVNVRHFAFPYGRAGDCGPRDFELARQAGFHSAATTTKGLLSRRRDEFCLPRNTINGGHRSLAAMEMHLTGLTGVAARLAGRD